MFPCDLVGSGMDWAPVLRIVLVLGIVGSVIIGRIAALDFLFGGQTVMRFPCKR